MGATGVGSFSFRLFVSILFLGTQYVLAANNFTTLTLTTIGSIGHYGLKLFVEDYNISNVLIDTTQSQLGVLQCEETVVSAECSAIDALFDLPHPVPSNPGKIELRVDYDAIVNYTCDSGQCSQVNASVSFVADSPTQTLVDILLTDTLTIEDPALHPFTSSHGIIGLSYTSSVSTSEPSSFDKLLRASSLSSRRLFGLDYQSSNSSKNSTMQLGGLSEEYSDAMVWGQYQARDSPVTHNVFVHDFSVCGAELYGNWSNSWETKVDTSSACLVLPREFFDTLMAWLPVTSTDADGYDITDPSGQRFYVIAEALAAQPLPVLQFRLSGQSKYLYIPVSDLLLPPSVLKPEFQHLGSPVCVISGGRILINGAYSSPPPSMVFGTRALQALYFAADMDYPRVGFANKHSKEDIDTLLAEGHCMPHAACIGRQKFLESSNSCEDPGCSKYYFMRLNDKEKICEFKPSAVAGGIAIVVILVVCEVLVYLVTQYSLSHITSRRIDPVTAYLGKACVAGVDAVILAAIDPHRRIGEPEMDDHQN